MLNHWSNGDSSWSGGPPATDTAITVSYVKAYFNTSDVIRNTQWAEACGGNWEGRTCVIPEFPLQGISPLGAMGNRTGKTDFFMYGGKDAVVNQTVYPAATAKPGGGLRTEAGWVTLAIAALTVLLVVVVVW